MAKPNGWNPKTTPISPKKVTKAARVNLRVTDFEDLILQQGVKVKVYRTSFCPKVKSIDGAEHEIDCNLCHGSGFVDCLPIETWAFIQNQSLEKNAAVEGLHDGNSVAVTFQQGIELQYFTLVELLGLTEIFFERVKRAQGQLDVLKYPTARVNFLLDYNGKQYYEGSDFCVDANGNVKWHENQGPIRGTIYTINYEAPIRFRAIQAMHSNRFVQAEIGNNQVQLIKMNEQWLLRKEFLVVRKDIDGNVIAPNAINFSDSETSPE